MPWAFARLELDDFDVVISTSSAFSKNVRVRKGAVNVCYCHTPPRYLWDLWDDYRRRIPGSRLLWPVISWLRRKDLEAARRVSRFVANSHFVAERIERLYGRTADVVYPPVDLNRIALATQPPGDFYLVVARLVGYKRIDLAVQACTALGRRLVVVGRGSQREQLEKIAGPTVEFRGELGDAEVVGLLRSCRAFLFPGIEDFGIAPVEAQAAGRPVIAFAQGGALETVVDGVTGLFFHAQTASALADAILAFEAREFDPAACRRNAERFDASVFRERIRTVVASAIASG